MSCVGLNYSAMKRIMSFLGWIIGEGILLAAFLRFGRFTEQGLLILHMVVASVIYILLFIDLLFPKANQSGQSSKKAVGPGVRWFFIISYSVLATGAMFYFGFVNPIDLTTHLIVHSIFISVLVMGLWGAFRPSKRTESNERLKLLEHNPLVMIRNAVVTARSKAEKRPDAPAAILNEIKNLHEHARLIAPGNETLAYKMEAKIMMEMNQLNPSIKQEHIDLKRLNHTIKNCSKLVVEHRQIYSHQ